MHLMPGGPVGPGGPSGPAGPGGPVVPAGISKSNTAAVDVPVFVTAAGELDGTLVYCTY